MADNRKRAPRGGKQAASGSRPIRRNDRAAAPKGQRDRAQHGQRQAQVAAVVEHHRRHEGVRVIAEEPGRSPGENARPEHDEDAAADERQVAEDVKILRRHRREDEQREKEVDAQLVDPAHIGLAQSAVDVADGRNQQDGRDDADDAQCGFHVRPVGGECAPECSGANDQR